MNGEPRAALLLPNTILKKYKTEQFSYTFFWYVKNFSYIKGELRPAFLFFAIAQYNLKTNYALKNQIFAQIIDFTSCMEVWK